MEPATWVQRFAHESGNEATQLWSAISRSFDYFAAEVQHISDCVMPDKKPLTPDEELCDFKPSWQSTTRR